MAPRHADALRSMRRVYLDAGRSDEAFLDLGAQAFSAELSKLGVRHSLELFDGRHGGIQYRYPGAIRELLLALVRGSSRTNELAWAGPGELARRVRAGELSPHELVEFFLARIEALNPRLNAVRVTLADEALAAADALERAGTAGPLAGVPVAIKDDLAVAGQRRTVGSKSVGPPEPADAIAVARLRGGGRHPDRDHQRAGADPVAVDRDRRERDHAQPVGPGALTRWLVRGLGRRRGGGDGAGRDRLGRRRLDPDSCRVLRARGYEADTRPGDDGPAAATPGSD